jgi:MSHA pilin protein MshD
MWNEQRGMTLVELIIAMVIISVGVGGILVVYNTTTKNSVDPLIQKQMVAVAEGMMEEIIRMPFAETLPHTSTGCVRATYDDLRDYDGYHCPYASDMLGGLQLPGYLVDVTVVADTSSAFNGVPAGDALKITVKVTYNGSIIDLIGWRTNYARLLP